MRPAVITLLLSILASLAVPVWAEGSQALVRQNCRWQRLGVDGGGFLLCLELDKTNPDILYVGSDVGGIHRSEDGGKTWRNANTGFLSWHQYAVGAILADDRNPGRVFAMVGDTRYYKAVTRGGLFRSDDGGRHWRRMTEKVEGAGNGPGARSQQLAFDPTDHNILYAGGWRHGLWVSRDAGETWTQLPAPFVNVMGIAVDPDDRNRLLLWGWPIGKADKPAGLFESRDAGKTWTKLFDRPGIRTVQRHPQNHNWLLTTEFYRNHKRKDGAFSIYLSKNRGKTWQRIAVDPRCTRVEMVRWHVIHGKDRIWVVGSDRISDPSLFYTDDFGKTWRCPDADERFMRTIRFPKDWWNFTFRRRFSVTAQVTDLRVHPENPNIVWCCDSMTAYRSTNGGKTWRAQPYGLDTMCIYQIVPDPKQPNTLYVNCADIGLMKSTDGGKLFYRPFSQEIFLNETHQTWVSPKNSNHVMATVTVDWKRPEESFIAMTTQGDGHWKRYGVDAPFHQGGRACRLTGLAVLDGDGKNILVSYSGDEKHNSPGGVYASHDGGKTWRLESRGLPKQDHFFGTGWDWLPNLLCAGDSVYALGRTELYRRNQSGGRWEKLDIPKGKFRTLAVCQQRPDSVWVGSESGLYVSHNKGKTWEIHRPKGMERCFGVAVDPHNPERWFIAVPHKPWMSLNHNTPGIYMTGDDGKTWLRLTDMPCTGQASRITCDPHRKGVIYVGTDGSGAWRGQVESLQ